MTLIPEEYDSLILDKNNDRIKMKCRHYSVTQKKSLNSIIQELLDLELISSVSPNGDISAIKKCYHYNNF